MTDRLSTGESPVKPLSPEQGADEHGGCNASSRK